MKTLAEPVSIWRHEGAVYALPLNRRLKNFPCPRLDGGAWTFVATLPAGVPIWGVSAEEAGRVTGRLAGIDIVTVPEVVLVETWTVVSSTKNHNLFELRCAGEFIEITKNDVLAAANEADHAAVGWVLERFKKGLPDSWRPLLDQRNAEIWPLIREAAKAHAL